MSVLSKLEKNRVLCQPAKVHEGYHNYGWEPIPEDYGKFEFLEACDGYFGVYLTKDEVLQLAAELIELANS